MDSRVDLLDLLAEQDSLMDVPVPGPVSSIPDSNPGTVDAVKLLQSVAEETNQMLATASNNNNAAATATTTTYTQLQSAVVAQAPGNLQSVVQTESGVEASVDHLLDMLAGGVDPGDLGSMTVVADSDILTSVSAEDVDSILSSEPSSPVAEALNPDRDHLMDALSQLPPQQSNSLLAQYLLGDIATSKSAHNPGQNLDLSDLESLSDNLSDDDSDYVPSFVSRARKARPSPYARKTAKSNPKTVTVMSKEERNADKKQRKKQQNKDAATRYRLKKRQEADLIDKECNELEERNVELRDKVDQMTTEIGYLKNLLAEVYKARAVVRKKKSGK